MRRVVDAGTPANATVETGQTALHGGAVEATWTWSPRCSRRARRLGWRTWCAGRPCTRRRRRMGGDGAPCCGTLVGGGGKGATYLLPPPPTCCPFIPHVAGTGLSLGGGGAEQQAVCSSVVRCTRRRWVPPTEAPSAGQGKAALQVVLQTKGRDAPSISDGGCTRRTTGGMGPLTALPCGWAEQVCHTGRWPHLLGSTAGLPRAAGRRPTGGTCPTGRPKAGADARRAVVAERVYDARRPRTSPGQYAGA